MPRIRGTSGNDVLSGTAKKDTILGFEGDDFLIGLEGDDTLLGGAGADILDGGAGADKASYFTSPEAVFIDLSAGTGSGGDAEGDTLISIEIVEGSLFGDILIGDDGANELDGSSGDDQLFGGAGDDILTGGDGNDVIDGGDGADVIRAGAGDDIVTLGVGDGAGLLSGFAAVGGAGFDTAILGPGFLWNTASWSLYGFEAVVGNELDNIINGHRDDVNYNFAGGGGNDIFTTAGGDDTLDGGDGNDILAGGAGSDNIDGGDGSDTASYASSGAGVSVDLLADTAAGGDAAGDTLTDIENLEGSQLSDSLVGDSDDNVLSGLGGDDILDGGGGDDTLLGGDGNDIIDGGDGADVIRAGAGDDVVTLGAGDDLLTGWQAVGGAGFDTAILGPGFLWNTASWSLYGFEAVVGNDLDNIINGHLGDVNYNFQGGGGDDVITTAGGDDTLDGGDGDDILNGGAGNDVIDGGAGANVIRAGAGDDIVTLGVGDGAGLVSGFAAVGGAGFDTAILGPGFLWNTASWSLYGFEAVVGNDLDNIIRGHLDDVNYNFQGGGGDDVITTAGGDDIIDGGAGNDVIDSGSGADVIRAGAGDDIVTLGVGDGAGLVSGFAAVGGAGFDTAILGPGFLWNTASWSLYGFEAVVGNDLDNIINGHLDSVNYNFQGGGGNDTITTAGGDDIIDGGAGADVIRAGAGDDIVTLGVGDGAGLVSGFAAVGGAGFDTAILGPGFLWNTASWSLYGFEAVVGNDLDNIINGHLDSVNYNFQGGGGNDTITTAGGDDVIDGGAGADVIRAGAGDDIVTLGVGDGAGLLSGFQAVGGAGFDTAILGEGFLWNTASWSLYGFEAVVGNDLDNIIRGHLDGVNYNFQGGGGDDTITTAGGNDIIDGGAGADVIRAGAGDDIVTLGLGDGAGLVSGFAAVGGAGFDTAILGPGFLWNTASWSLYGFEAVVGNDLDNIINGHLDSVNYNFQGGGGDDTITTAGGDDVIDGGAGDDILNGGAGADSFIFDGAFGEDVITDFEDGADLLDLSAGGLEFADLTITQDGLDVLIEDGLGNSITLLGITSSDITADDFFFG